LGSTLAWVCFAQGWGGAYRLGVNVYYYARPITGTGLFHASQLARDFSASNSVLWQTTYPAIVGGGTVYAYAWDGVARHDGFGYSPSLGTLSNFRADPFYPALLKKYAYNGFQQVNGYWHSAWLHRTFQDSKYNLTPVALAKFTQWADWMKADLISEGNVWSPMIFAGKTTNDLYEIDDVQVLPRCLFYNKRATTKNHGSVAHDNLYLPPFPRPTPDG
jgi:hypothetical protein